MSKEYNFQKELRKHIFNSDEKLNRHELLNDIFKSYVARCLEFALRKNKDGKLEASALHQIRRNLIDEFRSTELGEYQRSIEYYEHLFDVAMQEIFNDASHAHEGINKVSVEQSLQINKKAYINEGGLFVPSHLSKN